MLLTVGERVAEDFDARLARMGTGWAGGIAHAGELCGAVATGVMLIGLKCGRVSLTDGDTQALALTTRFRIGFEERLGFLQCREFTGGRFNEENHRRCAAVIRGATELLLDLLEDPGQDVSG